MDIQWTTEAVEAKAKEMIHMWEPHCSTTMETVLAHHLAYLTASHLQLQEAYRVNVGSVVVANQKAELTEQSTKVAVSGLSQRLERLEG
jgi:hypothetical protein|tara:strand:+ start:144 stop:410 length:267 start_codon:yes stop_codon:yes gene_type:complete